MSITANMSVMVVDDCASSGTLLKKMLGLNGYRVSAHTSGQAALQAALASPPDLVLLDVTMPGLSGYETCALLNSMDGLRGVPVLFISGLTDTLDKVRAFEAGGVDYITKPFHFEEVLARVRTHLELRHLRIELEGRNRTLQKMVADQVEELTRSQMATIVALAKLAESRDDETGRHIERVQTFCGLIAGALARQDARPDGVDEKFVLRITQASPLHDIGKVGIADRILLKPGRLDAGEFEIMKTHTVVGAHTLQAVRDLYPGNDFVNMGIAIARSHHERWNGGGYPDGLQGEEIPLSARIMSVADCYDALRSERCYKAAMPHDEACELIIGASGTQFDPSLISIFKQLNGGFDEIWRGLMANPKGAGLRAPTGADGVNLGFAAAG